MEIYRRFTKQTDHIVRYLSVARQYEHHTRVEVPKLKHAPVNLGNQLDEYLRDPDFEIHRRQYLAEQAAKKKGGFTSKGADRELPPKPVAAKASSSAFPDVPNGGGSSSRTQPTSSGQTTTLKAGPAPDLIDFFESIEQNQTPMATQSQPQPQVAAPTWQANSPFTAQQQQPALAMAPTGFVAQPTGYNPFLQQNTGAFVQQQTSQPQVVPPQWTVPNATGYVTTVQPQGFQPGALGAIPQDSVASFPQQPVQQQQPGQVNPILPMQTGQLSTNPFRQSIMAQQTGMPMQAAGAAMPTATGSPVGQQPQSTNPFARPSTSVGLAPSFYQTASSPQQQPTPQPQQQFGTVSPPALPQAQPLQSMITGTNPFAQGFGQTQRPQTSAGALAPQPTGTNPFRQVGNSWAQSQERVGGGLDQLETVPVFPRATTGASPWGQ